MKRYRMRKLLCPRTRMHIIASFMIFSAILWLSLTLDHAFVPFSLLLYRHKICKLRQNVFVFFKLPIASLIVFDVLHMARTNE